MFSSVAFADDALIAVATNFFNSAKEVELRFERSTQHEVTLVSGSTGKLYAQILHGAPFDAFLAADRLRPELLETSEFGVADSQFTYAIGQLVLASSYGNNIGADIRISLQDSATGPFAIANPGLAPYGKASREALQSLQLWAKFEDQVVFGENVGQTYAMIATGNVQLGIVALSQVMNQNHSSTMHYIKITSDLHEPIRQDAVLLAHGAENDAARAFLQFLRADETQELLLKNGYGIE